VDSAADSASYESPETKSALKKLKAGYERVGLRFPTEQRTDVRRQLNALFQSKSVELSERAKAESKDASGCMPSSDLLEKAVASGTIDSSASKRFNAAIEECYQSLDISIQ